MLISLAVTVKLILPLFLHKQKSRILTIGLIYFNQLFTSLYSQEKNLRDEMSARHTTEFSEMVQVKEKEKEMKFELNYLQERLNKEQENVKKLQEEVMEDGVVVVAGVGGGWG